MLKQPVSRQLNLADYQIDPVRGFLPSENPLRHLPPEFDAWERIAPQISALIMTRKVRSFLQNLPVLDADLLTDHRQLERAMLLLTTFAGAYVWGDEFPAKILPRSVAIPLCAVAEKLSRPPIVAHASLVLNNWRLLDPTGEIDPDNLDTLQDFLGGMDEKWFYLATVGVEIAGAPILLLLVELQTAVAAQDHLQVTALLSDMKPILDNAYVALERIQEKCAPYVFYHRVRPYLAGWETPGVIYEGVSDEPRMYSGGSAAQSSLIQAIDAGLGVEHAHPASAPFLLEMRKYMPPAHREFVETLETVSEVRQFVQANQNEYPLLRDHYNACVQVVDAFRKKHMEIAVRYISHQARDSGGVNKGTGGTDFVEFLSESRKETRAKLLDE
jgi:indoleamine 2,3-dioxygenase